MCHNVLVDVVQREPCRVHGHDSVFSVCMYVDWTYSALLILSRRRCRPRACLTHLITQFKARPVIPARRSDLHSPSVAAVISHERDIRMSFEVSVTTCTVDVLDCGRHWPTLMWVSRSASFTNWLSCLLVNAPLLPLPVRRGWDFFNHSFIHSFIPSRTIEHALKNWHQKIKLTKK